MRLLLDTNALIWAVSAPEELGAAAEEAIRAPETDVFVSLISLWEIAIKLRVGKLKLPLDEVERTLRDQGFAGLALTRDHLRTLAGLPFHHRDPFDHLLIAQAISEDLVFVTRDDHAQKYPARLLRC